MRFHTPRILSLPVIAMLALAACDDDGTGPVQVAAPTGVQAVATGQTSVRVTWNAVPQADSYEVDRSASGGAFATVASAVAATSFDDSGLAEATEYRYRVRALRGTTPGAHSSEVAVTTEGPTGPLVRTVSAITESQTFHSDTTYVLTGYVKVSDGATLTIEPGTRIVQGSIEKSNVNAVVEMARMIEVTRAYTSLASIISRADELRRSAIERLADVPA